MIYRDDREALIARRDALQSELEDVGRRIAKRETSLNRSTAA